VSGHEDGTLHLSLTKKREILLNNIFGVDIDHQAVEVAQLSLYLKLLEEETTASAHQYQLEFHETLLPSLSQNIICGNSLIGTDILDEQLFEPHEERKLNPMNLEDRFPAIMKRGGFDAVIGNPPWISLSGKFGNEILSDFAVKYLIQRFHGNTYMPNMYEYFVAQGLNLVRQNAGFSFVVPDRLGFNTQFVDLRKRLLLESHILSLLYKVPFPGITADTMIFVLHKGAPKRGAIIEVSEYGKHVITQRQEEFVNDPCISSNTSKIERL